MSVDEYVSGYELPQEVMKVGERENCLPDLFLNAFQAKNNKNSLRKEHSLGLAL